LAIVVPAVILLIRLVSHMSDQHSLSSFFPSLFHPIQFTRLFHTQPILDRLTAGSLDRFHRLRLEVGQDSVLINCKCWQQPFYTTVIGLHVRHSIDSLHLA